MRTAALILMLLSPAAGPRPTPPLLSATLVGFLPNGDLLVLEARGGGEALLLRVSHDGSRSALVERDRPPSLASWVEQRRDALGARAPTPLAKERDRWRTHGMDLFSIREAPLGGRRFVELKAQLAEHEITVWRMPSLSEVDVGPLHVAPNSSTLVVTYAQSGRRGIDTIDLSSVRAALLNLRALALFRRGDHDGAAALLEEAITVAPHAGDAVYNLACLHARMGQLARAKTELSIALGIDRVRFRLLALDDPDLEPLREDREVRSWLGLKDPD
jgi:hypothetical protein